VFVQVRIIIDQMVIIIVDLHHLTVVHHIDDIGIIMIVHVHVVELIRDLVHVLDPDLDLDHVIVVIVDDEVQVMLKNERTIDSVVLGVSFISARCSLCCYLFRSLILSLSSLFL